MQDSVKVERWKYIGGSDIPAIMNLSPFKKRWDLLREKAQLQEDTFAGSVYTDYGNTMEPKIRDYINKELGHCFIEGRHYDEENGIRFHTDGEDEVTTTVLEVKTTSNVHEDLLDYKLYLVQLLFEIAKLGWDNGLLAVYERPEDMSERFDPTRLQLFTVFANEHKGLIAEIFREVERFQIDVQRLRENPFLDEEDFIPKDLVGVSNQIIALEETLKQMKAVEEQNKKLKEQLKELMELNKIKTWITPSGVRLTLVEDAPDKMITEQVLDEERLAKDLPELFMMEDEGGYIKEVEKKKPGRKGFVKITIPKEA